MIDKCILCNEPIPRGIVTGVKPKRAKKAITCGKIHARYYRRIRLFLYDKLKRKINNHIMEGRNNE